MRHVLTAALLACWVWGLGFGTAPAFQRFCFDEDDWNESPALVGHKPTSDATHTWGDGWQFTREPARGSFVDHRPVRLPRLVHHLLRLLPQEDGRQLDERHVGLLPQDDVPRLRQGLRVLLRWDRGGEGNTLPNTCVMTILPPATENR